MDWFNILKAARKCAEGEDRTVTAAELAAAARIPPDVASAWLGKFARWGYVLRTGRDTSRRGRPQTVYTITRWGMEFRAKAKVTKMPRRLKVANPKKGSGAYTLTTRDKENVDERPVSSTHSSAKAAIRAAKEFMKAATCSSASVSVFNAAGWPEYEATTRWEKYGQEPKRFFAQEDR